MINVAILGFGTVGRGVYDIISKHNTSELKNINVTTVLDRKENVATLKKEIPVINFVSDIDEVVNDVNIDIVVECMGGVTPAFEYVEKILKNGKKVVTSNKMLLATKYEELMVYRDKIEYEATVGGGIHIFHSIRDIKKIDKITSFKGIVNGTTNYILSKMTADTSLDFETVLKEAQKLGFAEADPTNDVEGYDAKYKAALLYNEIFNKVISLDDIKVEGITKITKDDIIKAKADNKVIKLIAEGNENSVKVSPQYISANDCMAHINSNLNAISIDSENLGVSTYVGQGAGKLPTAHAVVLDIVDSLR